MSQPVPTMARFLPSRPDAQRVDDVELVLTRSIANRIGISEELYWEIEGMLTDGRVPLFDGPHTLPDGITVAEVQRLYPVECAAISYVNDLIWVRHQSVKLGPFRELVDRLRIQHGAFTQPSLDIEAA
jgi:hypothetical protein